MKKIFIILFLCTFSLSYAQNNEQQTAKLLAEAGKMGKAFLAGDYKAFSQYTHPTIVLMMGGEEKLVSEITRSFNELKAEGVSFKDISYGEPNEMLIFEGQLQCTLPQILEIKANGGTLTSTSTLIAVSMDNGGKWYFVDPAGSDIDNMRKVIPTLSPDLKMLPPVDPSFEPDAKE